MLEIRNGNVCREPPKKVIIPVMPPRTAGLPRPVISPLSESPSENAMLMPAPVAEAMPTKNVVIVLCVAKAVAKMGARVETDPSIRPARPGCTTRKRKSRDESSLVLIALTSSASCPLIVGGTGSITFVESEVISLSPGRACFSMLIGLSIGVFSSPDIGYTPWLQSNYSVHFSLAPPAAVIVHHERGPALASPRCANPHSVEGLRPLHL